MSYKLRTTPAMELKLAKIKRFCEKQGIKRRNGNIMLLANDFNCCPIALLRKFILMVDVFFQIHMDFLFSIFYSTILHITVSSKMDNVSDSPLQNCRNKLRKKVH